MDACSYWVLLLVPSEHFGLRVRFPVPCGLPAAWQSRQRKQGRSGLLRFFICPDGHPIKLRISNLLTNSRFPGEQRFYRFMDRSLLPMELIERQGSDSSFCNEKQFYCHHRSGCHDSGAYFCVAGLDQEVLQRKKPLVPGRNNAPSCYDVYGKLLGLRVAISWFAAVRSIFLRQRQISKLRPTV